LRQLQDGFNRIPFTGVLRQFDEPKKNSGKGKKRKGAVANWTILKVMIIGLKIRVRRMRARARARAMKMKSEGDDDGWNRG